MKTPKKRLCIFFDPALSSACTLAVGSARRCCVAGCSTRHDALWRAAPTVVVKAYGSCAVMLTAMPFEQAAAVSRPARVALMLSDVESDQKVMHEWLYRGKSNVGSTQVLKVS